MTAALGNPYALGQTGIQTSARTDRLALGASFRPGVAALAAASGMLHGPAGTRGDLTLLTDTLLRVDPFLAVVQGTHNTQQGQYLVPNVQQRDLAVPAKDASLFRRALVRVRVADSLEAGVASSATTDGSWLEVVSGALAASNPALPAAGDNALLVGELSIPSTASGQPVTLTRYNPRTVTRGGILPMPTEASVVALPTGLLWAGFRAFAEDTGAEAVWDGAAWRFYDTRWQTYTPAVSVTTAPPWTEIVYAAATRSARYLRQGRQVELNVLFRLGAGTSFGGLSGPVRIGYPPNLAPAATNNHVAGVGDPSGVAFVAHAGGQATGIVYHEQWDATPANHRMYFLYPTNAAALMGGASPTWNLTGANQYVTFTTSYEIA